MRDVSIPEATAMQRSRLIQRLITPRAKEFHAFGGGLPFGGLSEKQRSVTRTCFDFDQMGAAEFEFGAVPEALATIWNRQRADRSNYHGWTMSVDVKDGTESLVRVGEIYVIAPLGWDQEVECRIATWAREGWRSDLKEPTGLQGALTCPEKARTKGYLELDNGFFFFVDRDMYEAVASLLEVSIR